MSKAEPADSRLGQFTELSALLTGFGAVDLLGTGMSASYLRAADEALPAGVLDELLDALTRLEDGADREDAVGQAILGDAKLGPVARNVILLWYLGAWAALPQEWRTAYGSSPLDIDRVVSPEAYQAGLQWAAASAHPAGARQQGFGAWAAAPGAALGTGTTAEAPGAAPGTGTAAAPGTAPGAGAPRVPRPAQPHSSERNRP